MLRDQRVQFRNSKTAPIAFSEGHFTLKAAAGELGLRSPQVRHLALRLGLAEPVKSHAESYVLSRDDLERIRGALDVSLSRQDAADLVGLPAEELQFLVAAGEITPLARIGGGQPAFDRFLPSDIDAALARWRTTAARAAGHGLSFADFCDRTRRSPGELALQIVRRERHVTSWDAGGFLGCTIASVEADHPVHRCRLRRPRSWNGISMTEAAARLAVAPTVIRPLVDAGYLQMLPGGPRQMPGVCPSSLRGFQQTYASARLYADLMGITPREVGDAFRAARVERIKGPGLENVCVVRRASVVTRMGNAWNLDIGGDAMGTRLWSEIREYLRAHGSANRLVGGVGLRASLRSGDAKVAADICVLPERSRVELSVSADPKLSPARYARFLEFLPTLGRAWPKANCFVDPETKALSLVEEFGYSPVLTADDASRIAREVDARLTALRHDLRATHEQQPA